MLTGNPSSAETYSMSAQLAFQIYVMSRVLERRRGRDWLLAACVPRGGSLKSRSPVKYEIPERRSVGRTLVSLNIPGCLGNIMASIYN